MIFVLILFLCFALFFSLLLVNYPDVFQKAGYSTGKKLPIQLPNIAYAFFILLFSLITGFLLKTNFKKTSSAEIFFFTIFILSLSLESFRVGQVLLQLQNKSAYFGILLTRIVYFGKIFGVLCLFSSGLFAAGIKYQKFGIIIGFDLLLSLSLASTIPVDFSILHSNFLYKIGNGRELVFAFIVIEIFSVLNYCWAAFTKNDPEYSLIALGLFFVILGRELLFFMPGPVLVCTGFIFLIGGTILFSNRTHYVYLWS
ncbi:MAG: hypothetical protein AB1798_22875 [Spirochaetota bacterium]